MARIEPTSNAVVATVDLGGHGYDVALIDGSLWVSVEGIAGDGSRKLVRIDPTTNRIDRTVSLETGFWSLIRHHGLTSPRRVHGVGCDRGRRPAASRVAPTDRLTTRSLIG
jgi:hypothetical protein